MVEVKEEEMEGLFDALLDEPVFYEFENNGERVKIPIYSLGLNAAKLITKLGFDELPLNIKEKIKLQQELTADEVEIVNEQMYSKMKEFDDDSPAMQIIFDTLKLTFPKKSIEELKRIGLRHFQGLLETILKANNLGAKEFVTKDGETKTDFQKSQPEQSS